MLKIGLVYGHVASNFGDLCINKGVASIIKELYPNSRLHVVIRNPNKVYLDNAKRSFEHFKGINLFYFETPTGVNENITLLRKYINNPVSFLIDTGLIDCDIILSNSGEFLFSYKCDPRLDLLWRVIPAFASKSKGIKFLTFPSTLGPFETKEGSDLVKSYLSLNDAYSVRDKKSMSFVSDLNIQSTPVLLDPAFFIKDYKKFNPVDKYNIPRIGVIMRLEEFGIRVGGKRSSANYRNFKKNNFKSSQSFQITYNLAKEFIRNMNGTVDIFVQTRYDYDLAKSVQKLITEEGLGESINLIEPSSIEEYVGFLSKTEMVVSSRFHGCILSLLAGSIPLGIYFDSHGHKIPGLYEMLGISDYCIRANGKSTNYIIDKFQTIYNNRLSILNMVKEELNRLRKDTLSWVQENFESKTARIDYNKYKIYFINYLDQIK